MIPIANFPELEYPRHPRVEIVQVEAASPPSTRFSTIINDMMKHKTPRNGRILIIEDDLCLKTVLLSVLRKINTGLECSWVLSAEEAFDSLRREKFDLVVADHYLKTETTGMDVWRALRKSQPRTPFLLMSGIGVEKFLKMTAKIERPPLYLPKPFRLSECHFYLNSLLKGGFYV